MKGKIIFEEEQSFLGTWMWYLVIGISIFILGGSFAGWALSGAESTDRIIGIVIAIIVLGGVNTLFAISRLIVIIDESKIYYRYPPFVNKEKYFGKEDIQEMEVRKYKPIWEYGGYGYRYRFRSGRAMNVTGTLGLQLVLKNGKKILIGTQKPDSMQTAIRLLKENWGMNG